MARSKIISIISHIDGIFFKLLYGKEVACVTSSGLTIRCFLDSKQEVTLVAQKVVLRRFQKKIQVAAFFEDKKTIRNFLSLVSAEGYKSKDWEEIGLGGHAFINVSNGIATIMNIGARGRSIEVPTRMLSDLDGVCERGFMVTDKL